MGFHASPSIFHRVVLDKISARPRLLFAVKGDGEWLFFSSPQSQNLYEKSSTVVAADFHVKFSGDISRNISPNNCSYASGLLYIPSMLIPKEEKDVVDMICNPITGQYAVLPKLIRRYWRSRSFLGFDPIEKQFKVLYRAYPYCDDDSKILTLGTGKMRWRKIQCPLTHEPFGKEICINGILYYKAAKSTHIKTVIVCFDVRCEKFKFSDAEFFNVQLVNYKGKLAGIELTYANSSRFPLELWMWVLEDVQKQEWSKNVYTLWDTTEIVKVKYNLSVVGMTATGDIVLSMEYTCKPFYVFYFSPERKTLQSVEIQGFGEYLEALEISGRFFTFVDHVEDLNVNDTEQLKSSPLHKGLNIVRKRPKPKLRALCNSALSVKNKLSIDNLE